MRVVSQGEQVKGMRALYGAPTRCLHPVIVGYVPGEHKSPSPVSGRVERRTHPCGYCRVCVATRKSNWTGRLVAEASTSASVAFVTLTYKEEPESFSEGYPHIQGMLKRFREKLMRERGTSVRFFCAGERGEKRGRIHWHILFFFDKPTQLRKTTKRKLWAFWPHGWAHIQNLQPGENLLRKVRYTAKYCVKDAGGEKETYMRCSLRPGIGSAYFADLAVQLAKAGLPAHGGFRMGSVAYTRGPKKGQLVEFRLTGAMARNFCDVYDAAWMLFQNNHNVPATRFRQNFAREYAMPFVVKKNDYRTTQETIHVAERRTWIESSPIKGGYFFLHSGRDVIMITLAPTGQYFAVWEPGAENALYIERDIREIYTMHDDDADRVNRWLRRERELHCGEAKKPWETGQFPAEVSRRNTHDDAARERRERARRVRAQAAERGPRAGAPKEPEGATVCRLGRAEAEALGREARARFGTETHDDEFARGSSRGYAAE